MVGTATATASSRRAAAKAEEGRLLVEAVAEAAKSTAQASGSLVERVVDAADAAAPLRAEHYRQVRASLRLTADARPQ